MKHFVFFDGSGLVSGTTTCQDNVTPEAPPGTFMLETPIHHDPTLVYVVNGVVRSKPPRPQYPATFQPSSGSWRVDLGAAWADVRSRRNAMMSACDWSALPDVPLSADERARWAEYRQLLRDITKQPDPTKIIWPAPPGKQ